MKIVLSLIEGVVDFEKLEVKTVIALLTPVLVYIISFKFQIGMSKLKLPTSIMLLIWSAYHYPGFIVIPALMAISDLIQFIPEIAGPKSWITLVVQCCRILCEF